MPSNYSSSRSHRARAIVRAQLPSPCVRCRGTVTSDMRWEADHIFSRAIAQVAGWTDHQIDDASNLGPAHKSCNARANTRPTSRKTKAELVAAKIPKVARPTLENSKTSQVFSESVENPVPCRTSFLSDDAEEAQNER